MSDHLGVLDCEVLLRDLTKLPNTYLATDALKGVRLPFHGLMIVQTAKCLPYYQTEWSFSCTGRFCVRKVKLRE